MSAFAETINFTVKATNNKECKAYLHLPEKVSSNLPLIFEMDGTGIYSKSTSESLDMAVGYLFDASKAAALTIDKPGISYGVRTTEGPGYTLNSEFYKYTQSDLLECAYNALVVVSTLTTNDFKKIVLKGHSEGAMVFTRLYEKLMKENIKLEDRIQVVMLSGVPMLSWKEIIDYQHRDNRKFLKQIWRAYENKNEEFFKTKTELGFDYWVDVMNAEPLAVTLKKIAFKDPSTPFSLYHGLNDLNTIAQPVMDFENWNNSQKKEDPKLELWTRYYHAKHGLNKSAMNDMIFALEAILGDG